MSNCLDVFDFYNTSETLDKFLAAVLIGLLLKPFVSFHIHLKVDPVFHFFLRLLNL